MVDWLMILSPYPKPAIEAACMNWLRLNPRKRPTPGDISAGAIAYLAHEREMGRLPALPKPQEPPRGERCSPEAAARILAEFGVKEPDDKPRKDEFGPNWKSARSGAMPMTETLDKATWEAMRENR